MSPLIAAILSAVVPSVISYVEKKRGPKTGPDKFQDVFNAAIAVLQALAQRGVGPTQINDTDVKAAIETMVQSMKQTGTLQETSTAASPTLVGRSVRMKIEELI
jgi:hypothetical protein